MFYHSMKTWLFAKAFKSYLSALNRITIAFFFFNFFGFSLVIIIKLNIHVFVKNAKIYIRFKKFYQNLFLVAL